MKRIAWRPLGLVMVLTTAMPALAQNGASDGGSTTTISTNPSTPRTPAPTATPTPTPNLPTQAIPPVEVPAPTTAPPPVQVNAAPVVQAPPQQPAAIQPDAAYPNGFADPADPFANDMAARRGSGFPWGLLGLLGLLGLIPLFRGKERVRTVYVERDDTPRRVVRERIEDE